MSEALRHPYLQVSALPLPLCTMFHNPVLFARPTTNSYNSWTKFQPYHDPQDEPTADPIDPSFFDFDFGDPMSKEDLKGTLHPICLSSLQNHGTDAPTPVLIYNEIMRPDTGPAPITMMNNFPS